MSKPEADKDKTPSFYQRYRWPLLIGGGLLLGAAIGGGLLALAIFLGPWVLGGALIATLVKFVGIPLAIAIGAAAGAVLGTLVTGAILGVRHIIKSQKKPDALKRRSLTLSKEAEADEEAEKRKAIADTAAIAAEEGFKSLMEASADGTYAPLETGRLGRKESASSAGSTKGDLKVPFALALPGAPTPEKSHRAIVSSPRTGLHHTWQRGWFSRFSYGNLPTTLPAKSMASENRLNAWQRIALYPVATRLANAAFHRMSERTKLIPNVAKRSTNIFTG